MANKLDLPTQEIIEKYQEGYSIEDIAEMYGCSLSPIKLRLRKSGVKIRKPGRPKIIHQKKKKPKTKAIQRISKEELERRRRGLRMRKEAFIDFIIEVIEGMRKKRREGA